MRNTHSEYKDGYPKTKPSKARKSVAMTFRFTPEFREQLIAAAAHEHRSQASFLGDPGTEFLR